MHRTLWTLILALLLQWLASGAWAWHAQQAANAAGHCHDMVQTQPQVDTPHSLGAAHKSPPVSIHTDSHHCCAVGLGTGQKVQLMPLPQAVPDCHPLAWVSLPVQPDLRPPI